MQRKTSEILHKLDLAYMEVFNNPKGALVIADLKKHFMLDRMAADSQHATVVRALHSDPIRYILRRIEDGMDGKSVR